MSLHELERSFFVFFLWKKKIFFEIFSLQFFLLILNKMIMAFFYDGVFFIVYSHKILIDLIFFNNVIV